MSPFPFLFLAAFISSTAVRDAVTKPSPRLILTHETDLDDLSFPHVLDVAEGSTFNLNCQVEGSPHPEVLWFFKGSPILPDANKFVTMDEGQLLVVDNAEQDDMGLYECRADNASDLFTVRMLEPPHIVSLKEFSGKAPPIIIGLDSCIAYTAIGRIAVLPPCRAVGLPKPERWTKKGRPLDERDKRLEYQPDGSLLIKDVQKSDLDVYRCVASNEFGMDSKQCVVKEIGG